MNHQAPKPEPLKFWRRALAVVATTIVVVAVVSQSPWAGGVDLEMRVAQEDVKKCLEGLETKFVEATSDRDGDVKSMISKVERKLNDLRIWNGKHEYWLSTVESWPESVREEVGRFLVGVHRPHKQFVREDEGDVLVVYGDGMVSVDKPSCAVKGVYFGKAMERMAKLGYVQQQMPVAQPVVGMENAAEEEWVWVNRQYGKAIDILFNVPKVDLVLQQWNRDDNCAQRWNKIPAGGKENWFFRPSSRCHPNSNLYWAVKGTGEGARLVLAEYDANANNQKFHLNLQRGPKGTGDVWWHIMPLHTQFSLEVHSGNAGAQVLQWKSNNANSQDWYLKRPGQ